MKWMKTLCLVVLTMCLTLVTGCKKTSVEETLSTVTLDRSYRNPFTNQVEDAGGESAYVTGQAMVEGATYEQALLEQTTNGNYFLTFRMGLIDFSSQYLIQYYDGKKFQDATAFVAGTGSSENGTTYNVCCYLPKEDTVLRISMFVNPMGRNVIFFLKPKSIVGGNHTDFIPQYVSEGAKCDVEVKNFESVSTTNNEVVRSTTNSTSGLILSTQPHTNKKHGGNTLHYVISGLILVGTILALVIKGKGDEDDEDDDDE